MAIADMFGTKTSQWQSVIILLTCVTCSTVAGNVCIRLSSDVSCSECTDWGSCVPGSLPIDPWVDFAIRTQYEIQIDEIFDNLQLLDAHNAFNNRADGYGRNDTCEWPPPYGKPCFGLANHEFSVTDMLTMGIRGIEFDPWYCFDQMRLAHLGTSFKVGCLERNKLFADGVQEIADFLNKPENTGQIIRVYMNEKADQGHDDLVNHPFQASFGNRALTPSDLNNLYGGKWPTMRKMREDGKNVVIVVRDKTTDRDYTHGDIYIHRYNWTNIHENEFTPYPLCGGKTPGTGPWRVYSDSTFYTSVYNGPNVVGCILDFTELMKCHIHYPASDHTNPQLIRSAVFTWAEGEPTQQLDESSCVFLSGSTRRWHVANNCDQSLYFACQHVGDRNLWTVSDYSGPYEVTNRHCPPMYKFSIPQNGYRQQKLLEAAKGRSTWLNYGPWLPGYVEPKPNTDVPPTTESSGYKLTRTISLGFVVLAAIGGVIPRLLRRPASSSIFFLRHPSSSVSVIQHLHPSFSSSSKFFGVSVSRVFIHLLPRLLPPLSCAFIHVPPASSVGCRPSSSVVIRIRRLASSSIFFSSVDNYIWKWHSKCLLKFDRW
ncbi:uncharacterized protein MT2135-like isoform X1 [Apostichopus japonicus]|uniref:uncharacterized protein MT2135-like isoform X1 n=1 Tax=Stichopus japonicus TaxID=307972 RepID=UPI003AB4D3EB